MRASYLQGVLVIVDWYGYCNIEGRTINRTYLECVQADLHSGTRLVYAYEFTGYVENVSESCGSHIARQATLINGLPQLLGVLYKRLSLKQYIKHDVGI